MQRLGYTRLATSHEAAYSSLIYYNEVDRGGHFAAWQERELFAAEVRAGFRSLC